MKFKSKTELIEHIKELEESGYLEAQWHLNHSKDPPYHTHGVKFYKINFEKIEEEKAIV